MAGESSVGALQTTTASYGEPSVGRFYHCSTSSLECDDWESISIAPGLISSRPGSGPIRSVWWTAARMASATRRLRRKLRCASDSVAVVGSMTSTENSEAVAASVPPRLSETERLPSGASSGGHPNFPLWGGVVERQPTIRTGCTATRETPVPPLRCPGGLLAHQRCTLRRSQGSGWGTHPPGGRPPGLPQ
eukprot:1145489-Amphidinium_carterae.1